MKKVLSVLLISLCFLIQQKADACVGKTLYIGVSNSANEILLAEMVSVLVNERTGTAVNVKLFKNTKDLYNAIKLGEVNMLIENTDRGMEILGKQKEANAKTAFDTVKKEYRKNLNLVWLEPLTSTSGNLCYAPVMTVEILDNLPALPRLFKKLSGILSEESYGKLIKSVKSDEKPRTVARDFLKAKKII